MGMTISWPFQLISAMKSNIWVELRTIDLRQEKWARQKQLRHVFRHGAWKPVKYYSLMMISQKSIAPHLFAEQFTFRTILMLSHSFICYSRWQMNSAHTMTRFDYRHRELSAE